MTCARCLSIQPGGLAALGADTGDAEPLLEKEEEEAVSRDEEEEDDDLGGVGPRLSCGWTGGVLLPMAYTRQFDEAGAIFARW